MKKLLIFCIALFVAQPTPMSGAICTKHIQPGDLLFFGRLERSNNSVNNFEEAVIEASFNGSAIYHVALVESSNTVLHARTESGVQKSDLQAVLREELQNNSTLHLTLMTVVNQSDEIRFNALKWADGKIGCKYNDIFSEECLNSNGLEAYYCCQFVRHAYQNAVGHAIFETQPLNFNDSTGKTSRYWIDYFAARNLSIPIDGYGSHPSRLIRSKNLSTISVHVVDDEKTLQSFLNSLDNNFITSYRRKQH